MGVVICSAEECELAVHSRGMCGRHYQLAYRAAHPGVARRQHLMRMYRITPEMFQELLDYQGGVCAVCGTDQPGGMGAFHVDHDRKCCAGAHSCGKCIRGLLCNYCNGRVLTIVDSPLLEAAVAYASAPPARAVFHV